eukprot:CAMPEP_0184519936 /NCGR_PEP_ID=MMETSP0198_2-20121128/6895_1 /TAXON_ID=1112570 /ORGANISM="Thraustochytrium sp., Strain LLF1b" /LENGTH=488 /DNA_ID=CAMNT_0026910491 /DNA_START=151 /DNA_END=1617 /DNA_ORIENTATION=-
MFSRCLKPHLWRKSFSRSFGSTIQLEDAERKFRDGNVDTVVVAYTDLYGRLLGKRYDAKDFVDNCAKAGAHSCTYTFAVNMDMNPLTGFAYASWETGFGDFHMVPDLSSTTICAWNPGTAIVLCDARDTETDELVPIAPRSILRKQLACLQDLAWNKGRPEEEQIGEIKAASELEHYVLEDSFREAFEKDYTSLRRAGYYSEDYHILQGHRTEPLHRAVRRALRASGVPVENSKGETGIGQHELNVQYDEVLRMADRHMIFKQCFKEIAMDQGKSVTFMAKPFGDDAGSSCHIHASLVNPRGSNIFQGDDRLEDINGCSELFKHFLAGWIKHTPELFVLYSPTVNSYKRYLAGSWAPTATAWGKDNRTAGFRIVGSGPSLRIECRLPGADVNPYLAFAAAVASGIDGINNKLSPPPMLKGDGYSQATEAASVPVSLGEASRAFRDSSFVRETFGPVVQEHYARFYHLEQQAYDKAVTDWERKRYFEMI